MNILKKQQERFKLLEQNNVQLETNLKQHELNVEKWRAEVNAWKMVLLNDLEQMNKIENEIFNKNSLEGLLSEYKGIKINEIKELSQKNVDADLQDIFNYKESDQIQILDKEDYFLIFKNEFYYKNLQN